MKALKLMIIFTLVAVIGMFFACNKKSENNNITDSVNQLFSSNNSTASQKIIFARTDTSIGVVVDDKVKFYFLDYSGWAESENWEFTLPNGYKNVFARTDTSIGVVVDDKVKFYFLDYSGWAESENWEFTLPNGYKNVFARTDTSIGVVVDDKVKFYFLDYSGWAESENWEFNL